MALESESPLRAQYANNTSGRIGWPLKNVKTGTAKPQQQTDEL
jgi:hypothetical protein